MHKIVVLAILVTSSISLIAQNEIVQLVKKSNELQKQGKITESILASKKLIALMPESNVEVLELSLAKKYALISEIDSSFHYLLRSTKNDSTLQTLISPDFYFLIDDYRWKEHEKEILDRYEYKYGLIPKREYAKELLRLKLIDQAFFSHIETANDDLFTYYALWELKSKLKGETYEKLKELIKINGYPSIKEVPNESTEAAFLIIQHLEDLKEQTKYVEILKQAAENNDIEYSQYAFLLDRVKMRNGQAQIYGTQIVDNKLYHLIEPEKVNKRRKEIGMGPIEEYLKKMDITNYEK